MTVLKAFVGLFALLVVAFGVHPVARAQGPIQEVRIDNVELIVANQNCQNWCWAASSVMLVRSQGVFNVPQEEFVRRIYAPHLPASPTPPASVLPCLPTFGSFEPIRVAITDIYTRPDGSHVGLTGAYHYGEPTDVLGMVRSITEGRPFIFAWQGHAWVAYGIKYFETESNTLQFTEIELIDPLVALSGGLRPQFRSFMVGQDDPDEINGTFELLVAPEANVLGPPAGGDGPPAGGDGVVLPGNVQLPGGVVLPGGAAFPGGVTLPGGAILLPGAPGTLPGGQPLPRGGQAIAGPVTLPPTTTLPGSVVLPGGATVIGGVTLPGGAILPVDGEPLPPSTTPPDDWVLPGGTTLPGGALVPVDGIFLPGGAVLPGNTTVEPGVFNGPALPPGTLVPGGAYFIGGGALLPGGAVFTGNPFTLLQLILLIDGPEIIDEEVPNDDELPADNQPGGEMDVDQGLIVDAEPGLELSAD